MLDFGETWLTIKALFEGNAAKLGVNLDNIVMGVPGQSLQNEPPYIYIYLLPAKGGSNEKSTTGNIKCLVFCGVHPDGNIPDGLINAHKLAGRCKKVFEKAPIVGYFNDPPIDFDFISSNFAILHHPILIL